MYTIQKSLFVGGVLFTAVLINNIEVNAKAGWVETQMGWSYYDKQGDKITDKWISDIYYISTDGFMLADSWVKTTSNEKGEEQFWYYLNEEGKRVENSWKTIAGKKYYFNSEGKMHSGWYADTYYLGNPDDGALKTGWVKTISAAEASRGIIANDNNSSWYYFSNSGTIAKWEVPRNANAVTKVISGKTYAFDRNGKMLSGWILINTEDSKTQISSYKYFGGANDGELKTGWINTEPPADIKRISGKNGTSWYYLSNKGVPKSSNNSDKYSKSDLTVINGKTYLFDEYGQYVSGFVYVGDDVYYFGSADKGYMQVGQFGDLLGIGDVREGYYFTESGTNIGRGITGEKSGKLYYRGKLQKAKVSSGFAVISFRDSAVQNYVVNTYGEIQKNVTVSTKNGTVYRTDTRGILTHIDGKDIDKNTIQGSTPQAPRW